MFRDFLGAFAKEFLKADIDSQSQSTLYNVRQEAQAICNNTFLSHQEKQCRLQRLERHLQNYLQQQEIKKQLAGCVEQAIKHS